MQRCDLPEAELLLDGLPYRFQSPKDAAAYALRLAGFKGAVFLPRARQRWGVAMPVTPTFPPDAAPGMQLPPHPPHWGHGPRTDVEAHRLPEEETP